MTDGDDSARGEHWALKGAVKTVEVVMVLLLAGMVAMVFINVVLRYGFNTGINFSEEMSRYFFVWLVFVGAVITFREHAHIGAEALVRRFGRRGRLGGRGRHHFFQQRE